MHGDAKLLDVKVNFNMKDFNLVSGTNVFVGSYLMEELIIRKRLQTRCNTIISINVDG
jgi:hypothetical protein